MIGIDGIAPTLTTSQGGHRQPKILVGGDEMQKVFAMRGRYNEDGSTSQQIEFRKDDVTSTLTGVQKDNLLLDGGGEGMQQVTVNDLFCGAGGMGLGFKQAGFEIAGAWDFDKFAVQSYAHNVGDHVKQLSILDMTHEDMPKTDVWTFGFPCQDLSVAGKHAGLFEGKRSGLFFEVMRLLDETTENNADKMPKIIMAENVKGLKPYLETLENEYKKRGYKMYYTLYNSKYWGVPQNRERYFVVGVHESIEKEFIFPVQQTEFIPKLKTVLEPVVDEKYYISAEKSKVILDKFNGLKNEAHAAPLKFIARNQNELPDYAMCADCSQTNGVALRVKEATKKGYAEAVEGDSINLSHPNSKTRRGRVGKQVAQTLLTGQEQVFVDNDYRIRKLTPREYARLQGFPDSFELVVSNSQAYKQFGNAVTVNVAQAIAERIKMFLLSL